MGRWLKISVYEPLFSKVLRRHVWSLKGAADSIAMVWARHSLTDIREELECRSLKAIVHQAYEHMLSAPRRRLYCCLPLLLPTQCVLPIWKRHSWIWDSKSDASEKDYGDEDETLWAQRGKDLYVLCLSILAFWLLNNGERHLRKQFTLAIDDRVSWYHWKDEKQQTPRESIQVKIPNSESFFRSWLLLVLNRRGNRRCYAVRSLLHGLPLSSSFPLGKQQFFPFPFS